MQVSRNGHTNVRQSFNYKLNGQEEISTNFWFVNGTEFTYATQNRGPSNNTGLISYDYNIFGINDSLNTNTAYGSYNNLSFSEDNAPVSASNFADFTYYIGGAYDEQYANYSWVIIRTLPPDNIMPSYSFGKIQQKYTAIFISKNLPIDETWFINITDNLSVETFSSSQPEFAINLLNGTYSYAIGNSSKYYPKNFKGTFKLEGNPVIISISFAEFAFLKVITTPSTSVLTINGNIIYPSGWIYNVNGFLVSSIHNKSLAPGYYTLIVKDSGYHSFLENVSLQSGSLSSINVTLHLVNNDSFISQSLQYVIVAATASVGLVSYSFIKRKKK
jgi:hypothetical protein